MHLGARLHPGEPSSFSCVIGNRTINGDGELEGHPRTVSIQAVKEWRVELTRFRFTHAKLHGDTGRPQQLGAARRHRMRVARGDDHPLHTCLNEGIGAWLGPADVGTRLERDIHRASARVAPRLA